MTLPKFKCGHLAVCTQSQTRKSFKLHGEQPVRLLQLLQSTQIFHHKLLHRFLFQETSWSVSRAYHCFSAFQSLQELIRVLTKKSITSLYFVITKCCHPVFGRFGTKNDNANFCHNFQAVTEKAPTIFRQLLPYPASYIHSNKLS